MKKYLFLSALLVLAAFGGARSTSAATLASVSGLPAVSITATSATLKGHLTSLGGDASASVGFTIGTTTFSAGTMMAPGDFSTVVTISCSPVITIVAYTARATNSAGTSTSPMVTFNEVPCPVTPAAVTTGGSVAVPPGVLFTATGTITSTGSGPTVVQRGFSWSNTVTSVLPMMDHYTAQTGSFGTGSYSMNLGDAVGCGYTYHYRAFVVGVGAITSVGDDMTYTTPPCAPTPPDVSTTSATSLTASSATLNGTLNAIGSAPLVNVGFNYGTTTSYGSTAAITTPMTVVGPFSKTLTGLSCGTLYHYKAYGNSTAGADTGVDMTFTTSACPLPPPDTIPVVQTISITSITPTTATWNGNIMSLSPNATSVGFTWKIGSATSSTGGDPAIALTGGGTWGPGPIMVNAIALTCNTTYHIRAFAVNTAGTGRGADMTFTTAACLASLPVVTTTPATSIGATVAYLNGHLVSSIGDPAFSLGFDYGVTTAYGTNVAVASLGSLAPTDFIRGVSGLVCATLYHYRAYASNIAGISHGADMTFTTAPCPIAPTIPTVTTNAATPVTAISGGMQGSIVATGGSPVTTIGFDYGSTTAYGSNTFAVSGPYVPSTPWVGPFNLIGLTCNTVHHYRAYATNAIGTGYGADMSFTTLPCPVTPPAVTTVSSASITTNSATLNGSLTALGGAPSATVGFNYGLTTTYGSVTTVTSPMTSVGAFTKALTGLACGTTYHFRAYATNTGGTTNGADMTFTTTACPPGLPVVVTTTATAVTTSGGTKNGSITSTGGATVTARGFNFGLTSAYGSNSTVTGSFGTGAFNGAETGLTCATTYHYQAFATNTAGTGYGADATMTTSPCPIGSPTVTTSAATSVTTSTAVFTGAITATGGANATVRGFNYGTTTAYGTNISTSGSFGIGTFTANASALSCNTTYHYRAYATNSSGTGYGLDMTFTTSTCPAGLATVVTNAASSILTTSATLNGAITATGGANATVEGFNYGITTSYGTTTTTTGSFGVSSFTANLTGLACNTHYNYRAYATNSAGTAYGANMSFTTSACPAAPPVVATTVATSITSSSAQFNGSLTALGSGSSSATVGFNYGTTTSYGSTVTLPATLSSSGVFNFVITSLACSAPYHYQAYATNSLGVTAYGSDMTVTTTGCIGSASVLTVSSASVTTTSAVLNGNLLSNGGDTSTVTFFEYDTTTSYGMSTSGVTTAVGPFTASISGLSCNTLYHFRAGALNMAGYANGSDMTFTTALCPPGLPSVSTTGATSVGTTTATVNGSLTSTGGASTVTTGFNYGTTTSYGANVTFGSMTSIGAFNSAVSGLVCNTTYHFRAYGTSIAGTVYGMDAVFTTSACPITIVVPTVVTNTATSITATSATLNGAITATGGANATTVGFNYGTTTSYGTTITTIGSFGVTSFNSTPTLTCNTTYHFRAYAINSAGTSYGADKTVLTSACPVTLATVATNAATSVTPTLATLNGTLTSTGGGTVTVGFNYGISTSYGSVASAGSMAGITGPFSAAISGLSCGTTYHFRAYGTNLAGTVYGSDLTFSTVPCNPSVITVSAAMASPSTALFTGQLTGTGGTGVLNHIGFNYGPTTSYGFSVNASSPGTTTTASAPVTFTATATGLPTTMSSIGLASAISCNAPWHMQAWAWNLSNPSSPVVGADMTFCPTP